MSAQVNYDIPSPPYGDAAELLHLAEARAAANAGSRDRPSPIVEPAGSIGRECAAVMVAAAATTEAA